MAKTDTTLSGRELASLELIKAQKPLFVYIFSMVGDTDAVDDILQDVNLKIMRQLEKYDHTRPFLTWAHSIARYEVMNYRTRCKRERLVLVDNTFFENVASAADAALASNDDDLRFLEICLKKLPRRMRRVAESFYYESIPAKQLAIDESCTANAISMLLFKVRRLLAECIRKVRQEATL